MRDIIHILQTKGIIGAGGAGFPTYLKLQGNFHTIIINGAECEPLLKKDRRIMIEHPDKLAKILSDILLKSGAMKAIIALKNTYTKEINALKPYFKDGLSIFEMGNYYPAGDEQEIVYAVLGKAVPPGGIPLDVGAVVMNVETLFNVYNAIYENKPVVEKYITVTGEVKNPSTFKVPIGISAGELIEQAGGTTIDKFAVIDGGVMTGKLLLSMDEPITKTTSALIVLPKGHPALDRRVRNISGMIALASSCCTQCRMCTDMCPRYLLGHPLEPHKIMRSTYNVEWGKLVDMKTAFLCCDCGVCELYACPIGISPRTIIQNMRNDLLSRGEKPIKFETEDVRPEKNFRRVPKMRLEERLELMVYEVNGSVFSDKIFEPKEVTIRINCHIGFPAEPIVKVGDILEKFQMIAKPVDGKLSVAYHASISGKVVSIENNRIRIRRA